MRLSMADISVYFAHEINIIEFPISKHLRLWVFSNVFFNCTASLSLSLSLSRSLSLSLCICLCLSLCLCLPLCLCLSVSLSSRIMPRWDNKTWKPHSKTKPKETATVEEWGGAGRWIWVLWVIWAPWRDGSGCNGAVRGWWGLMGAHCEDRGYALCLSDICVVLSSTVAFSPLRKIKAASAIY